jgi:hypothetical protein
MRLAWIVICLLLSRTAFAQFDSAAERRLLDQANEARKKTGLFALKWDDKLAAAARIHAQKMAEAHSLSHRLVGEADLTDRIAATGLRFSSVAENIAYSTDGSEDFHDDWMHSPGHRANILGTNSDSLGVAVLDYKGKYYAVQDFARVVAPVDAATAEMRFAAEFNRTRAKLREGRAQVTGDPGLRSAACSMAASDSTEAKRIPHDPGARGAVAFTASEPEDIPTTILELARDPRVRRGVLVRCYLLRFRRAGYTQTFSPAYLQPIHTSGNFRHITFVLLCVDRKQNKMVTHR